MGERERKVLFRRKSQAYEKDEVSPRKLAPDVPADIPAGIQKVYVRTLDFRSDDEKRCIKARRSFNEV